MLFDQLDDYQAEQDARQRARAAQHRAIRTARHRTRRSPSIRPELAVIALAAVEAQADCRNVANDIKDTQELPRRTRVKHWITGSMGTLLTEPRYYGPDGYFARVRWDNGTEAELPIICLILEDELRRGWTAQGMSKEGQDILLKPLSEFDSTTHADAAWTEDCKRYGERLHQDQAEATRRAFGTRPRARLKAAQQDDLFQPAPQARIIFPTEGDNDR